MKYSGLKINQKRRRFIEFATIQNKTSQHGTTSKIRADWETLKRELEVLKEGFDDEPEKGTDNLVRLLDELSDFLEIEVDRIATREEMTEEEKMTREEFEKWWNPVKDSWDWENRSYDLAVKYSEFIDVWWNSEKFNWQKNSVHLIFTCHKQFDLWWNPEKFDWKSCSKYLAYFGREKFDKWWNSDRYNWQDHSDALAQYCHEHFDLWWDEKRFNWEKASWALAKHCSSHFPKWWNPEFFDWKESWLLAKHCSEHFDLWWNEEKYDWENSFEELAQYCSRHFLKWWDPHKLEDESNPGAIHPYYLKVLIVHCSEWFDTWWNPQHIVRICHWYGWSEGKEIKKLLFEYCKQHADEWEPWMLELEKRMNEIFKEET